MKILLMHPGTSWSLYDVYTGLMDGLKAQGHEVIEYKLDRQIGRAGAFLDFLWRRAPKGTVHPTPTDVVYLATSRALERALHHEVDWVLIVSGMYVHPDFLVLMKRAHLRTAVLFTESPYEDHRQINVALLVDRCWTNDRVSVETLSKVNPWVSYLPHAFNARVHKPRAWAKGIKVASHDVVFVGTAFIERVKMLADVDWTGIDLGLYGEWGLVGSRHPLRKFIKARMIDNPVTAMLYTRAKIGLNLFRTSMGFDPQGPKTQEGQSLGPRAYELAACRCFFISEDRPEVGEIFGDSVPTFKTSQELGELVRYFLARPKERRERAYAAHERVQGHTWDVRAQQVVADLRIRMEADALLAQERLAHAG